MDLDPRRLLTLQAVARHGGVSGAAQALRISASAVSQQLQALEQSAGVALIDRSVRSVQLTPAGLSLLDAAAQIEEALDAAGGELQRRQAVVAGRVLVGAFQSAIVLLVGPALERLRDEHPRLVVQVREVSDSHIVRLVRSGELDVGTVEVRLGGALPKGLGEVPVVDDPWRVIVPASWPVTQIAQLRRRPWISTFDDARADALAVLAKEHSFEPLVEHRGVEYPSVIALVAAGAGAAVVPSMALQLFDSPRVKRLRSSGLGSRTVTVLHRATRKEPTAAVQAVIDAIVAAAVNAATA
jgi:DNA-binding transcriptional LysR family regulator